MKIRGTITEAGARRTGIPQGTFVVCLGIIDGVAIKIQTEDGEPLGGCVSVKGETRGILLDRDVRPLQ